MGETSMLKFKKAVRVLLNNGYPCVRLHMTFINAGTQSACFMRTWDVRAMQDGVQIEPCFEPDLRGMRDIGILTAIFPGESIDVTRTYYLRGDGGELTFAAEGPCGSLSWGPLLV